jgi:transposase
MKGWQHRAANRLAPLWELLKLLVLNQKYLQLDESPLKVLDRDDKMVSIKAICGYTMLPAIS